MHCCKLSRHGSSRSGSKCDISVITTRLLLRQDLTTAIAQNQQTTQRGVWQALAELQRRQSVLLRRQTLICQLCLCHREPVRKGQAVTHRVSDQEED